MMSNFIKIMFVFETFLIATNGQGCGLPLGWQDSWVDHTLNNTISIDETKISTFGTCTMWDHETDNFVFVSQTNDSTAPKCSRCLSITQLDRNVIQLKSTGCAENFSSTIGTLTFSAICFNFYKTEKISYFIRLDAAPQPCPISGMNYNIASLSVDAEIVCINTGSTTGSCYDDTQIVLHYEKCDGTVQDDEMECFGTWVDNEQSYFFATIGNLWNVPALGNPDFRCIHYQTNETNVQLNISPVAGCAGVENEGAEEFSIALSVQSDEVGLFDITTNDNGDLIVRTFGHNSNHSKMECTNATGDLLFITETEQCYQTKLCAVFTQKTPSFASVAFNHKKESDSVPYFLRKCLALISGIYPTIPLIGVPFDNNTWDPMVRTTTGTTFSPEDSTIQQDESENSTVMEDTRNGFQENANYNIWVSYLWIGLFFTILLVICCAFWFFYFKRSPPNHASGKSVTYNSDTDKLVIQQNGIFI